MIHFKLWGRGSLFSILSLIFLVSCSSTNWCYYEEPRRGMDAAELSCQSAKGISALRFQLLKTDGEIVGLLSRFAGEFQVNELQETTLYLRIADVQLRFQARCMEGGQRCVLPDDLLLQIRKQLERGQEVTLHNKKQLVKLEPAKFMKYYRKLEKK